MGMFDRKPVAESAPNSRRGGKRKAVSSREAKVLDAREVSKRVARTGRGRRKAANHYDNQPEMIYRMDRHLAHPNGLPEMSGIKAKKIADAMALIAATGAIDNVGKFLEALQTEGADVIHSPEMRSVVLHRILPLVAEKKAGYKRMLDSVAKNTTSLTSVNPKAKFKIQK